MSAPPLASMAAITLPVSRTLPPPTPTTRSQPQSRAFSTPLQTKSVVGSPHTRSGVCLT